MPNIPQYQVSPNAAAIRPSEEGPSAFERVGRTELMAGELSGRAIGGGISELGRATAQIGDAYQSLQTQQDMVNGAHKASQLAIQAATDLPKVLANSDDPVGAFKNYMENTYEPARQSIMDGMRTAKGQAAMSEHLDSTEVALTTHGIAEAMSVAGTQAMAKTEATTNNLAMAAYQNPYNAAAYADQITSGFNAVKSTLTPQQQAALPVHIQEERQKVFLAAGQKLIDTNPSVFKQQLAKGWGAGDLSAEGIRTLDNAADYKIREQHTEAREASEDRADDYMGQIALALQTGDTAALAKISGQAANDPSLRGGARARTQIFAISAADRVLNGTNVPENQKVYSLLHDQALDQTVPDETYKDGVTAQVKGGQISAQSGAFLIGLHNETVSKDAGMQAITSDRRGAYASIATMARTNTFGIAPKLPQVEAQNDAVKNLQADEQAQRAKGLPVADVYDKSKPAFWGNQPWAVQLKAQYDKGNLDTGDTSTPLTGAAPAAGTPSGADAAKRVFGVQ
jgi:hypothetical protein